MDKATLLWLLVPIPPWLFYLYLRYSPTLKDEYEEKGKKRPSIGLGLLSLLHGWERLFSSFSEKTNRIFKGLVDFNGADCQEKLNRSLAARIASFTIVFFCFGSLTWGGIEQVRGDYDVFKSVPDGARCNDGWRSSSQGPGTCSWHGGVDYYMYKDAFDHRHISNPSPFYLVGLGSFIAILLLSYLITDIRDYTRFYGLVPFVFLGYLSFFLVFIPLHLITIPYQILYDDN